MGIELTSGFFNATLVDGIPDRTYTAEQVNDYFKGLISENGIFANVSSACQVVAGGGMSLIIKSGRGKVGSNWFEIPSDITVELSASDVILNRIDGIFISRDINERVVEVVVKEGTLATTPTQPTITRDDTVADICLAYITVNKNVSEITNSMIQDTRSNNVVCGWITGLINQMDTTTLFNQYQEAQDEFILEKTEQFNSWEEEQKTAFDTWFTNVKSEVMATNLYREYRGVYATVTENERTITIPTSINYKHNSTDILSVYVNGLLQAESKYAIDSTGTSITFTSSLATVGTVIQFVNKKCVEGTLDESTILRVEALENAMAGIEDFDYVATGADDNVTLSNMVRNFLDGVGMYADVADNANMTIKVNGVLGIGSLIDNVGFDFNSATESNRRVIVDFGNATIPEFAFTVSGAMAVFSSTSQVTIRNANVKAVASSGMTLYGFHGGKARDCKLYLDANNLSVTVYGGWACDEVNNCEITIVNATSSNTYGLYLCTKAITNTINQPVGTSIRANTGQLLLGNTVDISISVSGATDIGTIYV